ncbi:alpha/beta hydrolase [Verrucomicrobiaceae bacterium N1E253]|uniref:Alpha/beta hydrolase n=1 Tax=Oceaniferula marina TaxID=2748318 RepID=A0A851GK07_9BACT|nr:alpha/beta hydrolase [Oceaniferula marina]NWK55040.1 alpha/beta hydrolase [Oceaniferula marina]
MFKLIFSCLILSVTCAQADQWHGYQKDILKTADKKGHIVIPKQPAPGRPWVWRARFPDYHPEVDLILLKRGFHVAYTDVSNLYGSPAAVKQWDQFYQQVTSTYRLAAKVALECVSRGGLIAHNWAKKNPEKVACIYGEVPVCDIKSWPGGKGEGKGSPKDWTQAIQAYGTDEAGLMAWDDNPLDNLEPLAKARVPFLHVISLTDQIVPPSENTLRLFNHYTSLGGIMTVHPNLQQPTKAHGHHFPLEDPTYLADFISRNCLTNSK